MSAEKRELSFVDQFASAPTLEAMPEVIDPRSKAPANPPQRIQQQFVGSSYTDAYAEAERFVDRAFDQWPEGGTADQAVLDFGSGWGRITRMLLRRFQAGQIWASDVDVQMTAVMQRTLPGVNAVTNAPLPPSSFRDGMFDAVTAFSVFSHLSENAHTAWAQELGRITRLGGKVYITLLEENFLAQVAGAQSAVAAGEADGFATSLSEVVPDAIAAREQFRQGKFIYGGGGDDGPRSQDFYGWAAAPRAWLERVWHEAGFVVESWTPTGELFEQAMVVLVRQDRPSFGRRVKNELARGARRIRRRSGR